jgi:parvulin-like peptidyl-prolyl isomerase
MTWTRRWLTLVVVLLAAVAPAAERQVLEAALIRVNERVVTISDFARRLHQELAQLPERPPGDQVEEFARQLLASMVDELVIMERADEKRVTIDDDMLDQAIANLRQENDLLDDEAFAQALSSAGMTEEALRERYRQNLLLQRAVQGEIKPTEITAEEVRRVYEEERERFRVPEKVELEQLFFPVADDGSDRNQVLRRVEGLVERVRGGADLAAEATLAGVQVQSLGEIPVGDLRSDLRELLEPLEEGQLTDPVATAGGYQLIRLVRRIPAGYQPFEDVREQLRRRLSQESYQEQTKGLVDKLKSDYLVEVHEEYLPAAIERMDAEWLHG